MDPTNVLIFGTSWYKSPGDCFALTVSAAGAFGSIPSPDFDFFASQVTRYMRGLLEQNQLKEFKPFLKQWWNEVTSYLQLTTRCSLVGVFWPVV